MSNKVIADSLVLGGYEIDEVVDSLASNSPNKIPSVRVVNERIDQITLGAGANVGEIYNIINYGAKRDVVVGTGGTILSGTDNKIAIDKCIAAAPNNAAIYTPSGAFFTSPLAPISGAKTLHWVQDGTFYTNGQTLLTINAPGGADRIHTIDIPGKIFGKVNSPTHSKSNYTNGTGPVWSTYANAAILINQNVNCSFFRIGQISGFESGIKMVQGAGNGSQENKFYVQKIQDCEYGIHLVSTDGASWCDKNYFHVARVSCYAGLKIDGFSSPNAGNGQIFNGAFRSDEFKLMIESCTRIMECDGDITEPIFDITIEGGLATGVFDVDNAILCRIATPNNVRSPKWIGSGVLNTIWMTKGMGVDGRIFKPIYLPNAAGDASTFVGDYARIDGNGNIVVEVKPSFSLANRNALPANIKAANSILTPAIDYYVPTTLSAYTVGADDRNIYVTKSSGTTAITLPSLTSNVKRDIDIVNKGTGTVTCNGITLTTRQGVSFHGTGSAWEVNGKWSY